MHPEAQPPTRFVERLLHFGDDAAAAEDFRANLKAIGIKGAAHRNLISILAGLLKLGDTLNFDLEGDDIEEVCDDVGGLLGLDPAVLMTKCSTDDRRTLVGGLYEALVDWVMLKANEAIAAALVASVPVAVLLIAFQRQIIRGLTAGAVK